MHPLDSLLLSALQPIITQRAAKIIMCTVGCAFCCVGHVKAKPLPPVHKYPNNKQKQRVADAALYRVKVHCLAARLGEAERCQLRVGGVAKLVFQSAGKYLVTPKLRL